MGLQGLDHTAARMAPLKTRFYLADDVDALLARIRAAVDAERDAAWEAACWADDYDHARVEVLAAARAALDALLGEVEE